MARAASKSGASGAGPRRLKPFAARQAGGGVELGHRDVEGDGQHRRRLHHDPHVRAVSLPLFAGSVDVPAAAHQHVGEQNQIAGKMHEQPLAAGFHGIDGAAGEWGIVIDAREFGEDGFEARDGLAGERAVEGAGGAEDGVAFGHVRRTPRCGASAGRAAIARSRPLRGSARGNVREPAHR